MPNSLALKLTVYQPAVMAGPGEQVGFEYDLTIVFPDGFAAAKGEAASATSAQCDVIPVTGTLAFPNPAAPVISPFTGLVFVYDQAPIIGFPLTLLASAEGMLPFNMTMSFPASPIYDYSGAIKIGQSPGPFSDITAPFLAPVVGLGRKRFPLPLGVRWPGGAG